MYPLFNIQIFSKLIFYAFLENTRVVSAFFYQAKSRTNLVFKNNDFCVEVQLSLGENPKISETTTHLNAIHQSIMEIELHCKYEVIDTY